MRLSKREILLLALLVMAGGGWLTYHFILEPVTLCEQQLLRENNLITQELQVSAKTGKSAVSLQEEEGLQSTYQQLRIKIPQNIMIEDIIKYLEVSAQANQVKLVSINYKEDVAPGPEPEVAKLESGKPKFQTIGVQIMACGSHFNLLSYVLQLENAPRLYTIHSFKLALVKSQPIRSSLGDHGPGSETLPANISGTDPPESLAYDPDQVILNLDFCAYYGGS